MTETWKPVPEWETLYEVSDLGRVRSFDRPVLQLSRSGNPVTVVYKGKVLKPRPAGGRKNGERYLQLTLAKNNENHPRYVHHLVAAAFLGTKPEGAEVNHKDCDKTNNAVDNLEYVSRGENIAHALANGKGRWC
jgi:hypothetical protein